MPHPGIPPGCGVRNAPVHGLRRQPPLGSGVSPPRRARVKPPAGRPALAGFPNLPHALAVACAGRVISHRLESALARCTPRSRRRASVACAPAALQPEALKEKDHEHVSTNQPGPPRRRLHPRDGSHRFRPRKGRAPLAQAVERRSCRRAAAISSPASQRHALPWDEHPAPLGRGDREGLQPHHLDDLQAQAEAARMCARANTVPSSSMRIASTRRNRTKKGKTSSARSRS